ncbi:hypothetical protein SRABI106_02704 [Rahnella aquatilis]|nr:hypothetical protein SRABI106_02704 [Rahnella aquatilis]
MQFHGFIRFINVALRRDMRIGIAVAAQQIFDVTFHFGDFRAVIQFTGRNGGERFNFGRMSGHVAGHYHAGHGILRTLSNIDGNINPFLIRR